MSIYATKSQWHRALKPVVAWCVRRGVHPDLFTYGALLLSLVAGASFYWAGGNRLWLWLAPPCILLRLGFNLMDGQVARSMGLADQRGEVKNEFGDRIADSLIFLGLVFGGYADARLAGLVLAMILCVSYLGMFSKALGGPRLYTGIFAKGDRMLSLALFTFYPLATGNLQSYNFYLGCAVLAALVTIIERIQVIYGNT